MLKINRVPDTALTIDATTSSSRQTSNQELPVNDHGYTLQPRLPSRQPYGQGYGPRQPCLPVNDTLQPHLPSRQPCSQGHPANRVIAPPWQTGLLRNIECFLPSHDWPEDQANGNENCKS